MARRQEHTAEQHSVRVLKVGERVRHILSELLSEAGEVLARATSTNIPTPRPTGAGEGMK